MGMAVVLQPGDNNDLVRLLQARPNRDYPLYSGLVVDGDYGPTTTAVVKEFQRRSANIGRTTGAHMQARRNSRRGVGHAQ
jgi:hypothetical protein